MLEFKVQIKKEKELDGVRVQVLLDFHAECVVANKIINNHSAVDIVNVKTDELVYMIENTLTDQNYKRKLYHAHKKLLSMTTDRNLYIEIENTFKDLFETCGISLVRDDDGE